MSKIENKVPVPENMQRLVVPSPFLSGIRPSSKVMVQDEEGNVSEVNIEDHWFPAKGMSKRQKSKLSKEGACRVKLFAPVYNKYTGEVYLEYVSETEDAELAGKLVDDAWNAFNSEQERRSALLESWLKKKKLTLSGTKYACPV